MYPPSPPHSIRVSGVALGPSMLCYVMSPVFPPRLLLHPRRDLRLLDSRRVANSPRTRCARPLLASSLIKEETRGCGHAFFAMPCCSASSRCRAVSSPGSRLASVRPATPCAAPAVSASARRRHAGSCSVDGVHMGLCCPTGWARASTGRPATATPPASTVAAPRAAPRRLCRRRTRSSPGLDIASAMLGCTRAEASAQSSAVAAPATVLQRAYRLPCVLRSRARAASPVLCARMHCVHCVLYHNIISCVRDRLAAAAQRLASGWLLSRPPRPLAALHSSLLGSHWGHDFVTHWGDRRLSRVASGTAPPVTHQSVTVSPRVNSSALTREGRISALAGIYAC